MDLNEKSIQAVMMVPSLMVDHVMIHLLVLQMIHLIVLLLDYNHDESLHKMKLVDHMMNHFGIFIYLYLFFYFTFVHIVILNHHWLVLYHNYLLGDNHVNCLLYFLYL